MASAVQHLVAGQLPAATARSVAQTNSIEDASLRLSATTSIRGTPSARFQQSSRRSACVPSAQRCFSIRATNGEGGGGGGEGRSSEVPTTSRPGAAAPKPGVSKFSAAPPKPSAGPPKLAAPAPAPKSAPPQTLKEAISSSGLKPGGRPLSGAAGTSGSAVRPVPKMGASTTKSPFGPGATKPATFKPSTSVYPGRLPPDFGDVGKTAKGKQTKTQAPTNIFTEGSRASLTKDAPKEEGFQITAGQILLGLSFVLSIGLMIGTAYLVYKVGGIHFNDA